MIGTGLGRILAQDIRHQSSVTSLYGRFRVLKLPYREVAELWGQCSVARTLQSPIMLYVLYIPRVGACVHMRGSNRQCILSTHILALQDDQLYWCLYTSPGQCYNRTTVPPSRYCMRFIIFAKLINSWTTYNIYCISMVPPKDIRVVVVSIWELWPYGTWEKGYICNCFMLYINPA